MTMHVEIDPFLRFSSQRAPKNMHIKFPGQLKIVYGKSNMKSGNCHFFFGFRFFLSGFLATSLQLIVFSRLNNPIAPSPFSVDVIMEDLEPEEW